MAHLPSSAAEILHGHPTTGNSAFKTIKTCQYTSDLAETHPTSRKQKENFNKGHRAKDLHALEGQGNKSSSSPNKQGTGPAKWR